MPIRQTTTQKTLTIESALSTAPTSSNDNTGYFDVKVSFTGMSTSNITASTVTAQLIKLDGTLVTTLPDSDFVTNSDGTVSFKLTVSSYTTYSSNDLQLKVLVSSGGTTVESIVDSIFSMRQDLKTIYDTLDSASKMKVITEERTSYSDTAFSIGSANKDAIIANSVTSKNINISVGTGNFIYQDTVTDKFEAYHARDESITASVNNKYAVEVGLNGDKLGTISVTNSSPTDTTGVALSVYNEVSSINNEWNSANTKKMMAVSSIQTINTTSNDDVVDLTGADSNMAIGYVNLGAGNDILFIDEKIGTTLTPTNISTGLGEDKIYFKGSLASDTPTFQVISNVIAESNGDTYYIDHLGSGIGNRGMFSTGAASITSSLISTTNGMHQYSVVVSSGGASSTFTLHTLDTLDASDFDGESSFSAVGYVA